MTEVRIETHPRLEDTHLSVTISHFRLRVIDTCTIDGCLEKTKHRGHNGGTCLRHRKCGMAGCRAFCELAAPEPFGPAKEYCPDHYESGLWAYRAEDNIDKSKTRKWVRFYSELKRNTATPGKSPVVLPRPQTPALHGTTRNPGADATPSLKPATRTPRALMPSLHPVTPKSRTAAVPSVRFQNSAPEVALPTLRSCTPAMRAPTPALRPPTPHSRASVPVLGQHSQQLPSVRHATPARRPAEPTKCRILACAGCANESGKNYGRDGRTSHLAGLCAEHEAENLEATLRGEMHSPPPEPRKLVFQGALKDERKVDVRWAPPRPATPPATKPKRPPLSRSRAPKNAKRRTSWAGVQDENFPLAVDHQPFSHLQAQPGPPDVASMTPNRRRSSSCLADRCNGCGYYENRKCAEPSCTEPKVANSTFRHSHACSEHNCGRKREPGFAWCRFHAWKRLNMCWAWD